MKLGFLIGSPIGLFLVWFGFTHITWYHDLLVWSWTNPWMYVLGVPVGIALALLGESNDYK